MNRVSQPWHRYDALTRRAARACCAYVMRIDTSSDSTRGDHVTPSVAARPIDKPKKGHRGGTRDRFRSAISFGDQQRSRGETGGGGGYER